MEVIKRDGRKEPFDREKIEQAVMKAFKEVDGDLYNPDSEDALHLDIAAQILRKVKWRVEPATVEEIQDMVEDALMDSNRKDVARAYVRYRYKRELARNSYDKLLEAVKEKLDAKDVQNQNANVDEKSFGGRVGEAGDEVMRHYALEYNMSEKTKRNHLNNRIYVHDLNRYAVGQHNCLTIPFDKLLASGFKTRQVDIRPANSVGTALQLVAVIFQLQSLQQFGGCSASHIDHTLVPYVRKSFYKHYKDGLNYLYNEPITFDDFDPTTMSVVDEEYKYNAKAYKYAVDMTKKEIHQGVEALFHNLNSLQSRSGNQLPFTSINFGTCTEIEGRWITEEILNVSLEGLGPLHKTSIFPCSIFQVMDGVNKHPGEPNYDLFRLALKSTAKRLYPNYCNVDWSVNAGYDRNNPDEYVSTMGCRTYNGFDINGLGFLKDGRGNLAPTTIIMPTIAMEAKELYVAEQNNSVVTVFMTLLDEAIHDAKDSLIERYNFMCAQPAESARFMYENNVMAGYVPEEGIESALKHGTLAIGNLGLAETLQILIGKDHTTTEGMLLAKEIYKLFNSRCAEFKKQYRLNFGVYNTPAENLCYTAMKKFKAKYGEIPNVSDNEYFTNSMHVPVWHTMSAFEKINIESQLTGYSNAGCITYVELDSSVQNNIDALETLVVYAMDKDIPYFAINVPNDTCLECGYTGDMDNACPQCGNHNIQRLRRVTGYLTSDYKTAFNPGKQQETEMRSKHSGTIKFMEE